jgi:hypothetical protein
VVVGLDGGEPVLEYEQALAAGHHVGEAAHVSGGGCQRGAGVQQPGEVRGVVAGRMIGVGDDPPGDLAELGGRGCGGAVSWGCARAWRSRPSAVPSPVVSRAFWYSSSWPESRTTECAAASMATTLDPVRSSTSCASYQSAGLTYQPSRSSSDRRYVLDSGGRPNGIPGSRPMTTTGPRKPSSRNRRGSGGPGPGGGVRVPGGGRRQRLR